MHTCERAFQTNASNQKRVGVSSQLLAHSEGVETSFAIVIIVSYRNVHICVGKREHQCKSGRILHKSGRLDSLIYAPRNGSKTPLLVQDGSTKYFLDHFLNPCLKNGSPGLQFLAKFR